MKNYNPVPDTVTTRLAYHSRHRIKLKFDSVLLYGEEDLSGMPDEYFFPVKIEDQIKINEMMERQKVFLSEKYPHTFSPRESCYYAYHYGANVMDNVVSFYAKYTERAFEKGDRSFHWNEMDNELNIIIKENVDDYIKDAREQNLPDHKTQLALKEMREQSQFIYSGFQKLFMEVCQP